MKAKKNSNKNMLYGLIFGSVFMTIIALIVFIHPADVNSKESHQKLLNLRNNITGEFLSKCKIETLWCKFSIGEVDLDELAEILRNTQSAYAPGHSIPYAGLTFTEDKTDEYLVVNISIYEQNMHGEALLNCELFRNETGLAGNYFSSPELTEWTKKVFPEVFERF